MLALLCSQLATALIAVQASAPDSISLGTVWHFLKGGGPIMIPIGLCSVVTLAFAVERALSLRRRRIMPHRIDEALDHVRQGRAKEALTLCQEIDAPASRILLAGVRRAGFKLEEVERAMQDQGQKELEKLQSRIRSLSLIANLAPLLGLLGTVMGIHTTFGNVAVTGLGKPEQLAGGIKEALVATMAGLAVAIPALLFASWLGSRLRRLMVDADERVAPAVEWLADRRERSHAA